MAPKAMKTAKAMKAMKATAKQLQRRKKQREAKRVRDCRGGEYSRKDERKKLEKAEAENGELKRKNGELKRKMEEMEKAKKTWGRMGGGMGVEDFRREEEDYKNEGWLRGWEAAQGEDGGGEVVRERKKQWVAGFVEGYLEGDEAEGGGGGGGGGAAENSGGGGEEGGGED